MTPDEIISTIKRTTIPTLCVEGTQDKEALRKLEELLGIPGLILICNGRANLFEVFKRSYEFKDKKVVFLADKDLYVFKRIPKEYNGIIFTFGYSLENDVLSSKQAENLFTQSELKSFSEIVKTVSIYYWSECKKCHNSNKKPNWLKSYTIYERHLKKTFTIEHVDEKCIIWNKINSNPYKYLRGKNLLGCLHIPFSKRKKTVRYSPEQIIDISVRTKRSKELNNLIKKISCEFN